MQLLSAFNRFSPRFHFSTQIPRKVGVLGYGAIGSSFIEILLANYPKTDIVAVDLFDLPHEEKRFKFIKNKV
jgi:prephenate dehydrogenase